MKKGLVNKIVTYKHCRICSCPRYVHGRKEGVEQLAQDFLCVTLQGSKYKTPLRLEDLVKLLMQRNNLNIRRSFKAVQVLLRSFDNEYKILIFDYNDGLDGSPDFFQKLSKRKVEVLNNLLVDGYHCLSMETVQPNILRST